MAMSDRRRERQHDEIVGLLLAGEVSRACALAAEHLDEFPTDTGGQPPPQHLLRRCSQVRSAGLHVWFREQLVDDLVTVLGTRALGRGQFGGPEERADQFGGVVRARFLRGR